MPVEIRVPSLGESVVEATISQWLKSPGDSVKAGESVVELETDKVNVAVEAEIAGILGDVAKKVGDTVGIGEVLGILAETNGAIATPPQIVSDLPTATGIVPAASHPVTINGREPEGREAAATPTAQRIATENNIDLTGVKGTMAGGRIGKDDVAQKLEAKPVEAIKTASSTTPVAPPPASTTAPPPRRPIRRAVARKSASA